MTPAPPFCGLVTAKTVLYNPGYGRSLAGDCVEFFSEGVCSDGAEPRINNHTILDEHRGGLAGNVVQLPDLVVISPGDVVREQFRGNGGAAGVVRPTGNREEGNVFEIVVGYFVDDRQLLSACASPLSPEDHVDGFRLL